MEEDNEQIMVTRLILVRHAEAEGNFKRIFHGWTDGGITDKGHKQAEKAAYKLKGMNIDVIYSSTLKRTLQTAEYIAEEIKIPIIKTEKLKEINGGDWEGRKWGELPVLWPDEYDTWENKPHLHRMPNGECMESFQKRIIDEVEEIIKNNSGKTICIITHGTAIRALLCYFYNCDLEEMLNTPWFDNTAITVVDYENNNYKIISAGDTQHLGKELSTIENQEWWSNYIKEFEARRKLREGQR